MPPLFWPKRVQVSAPVSPTRHRELRTGATIDAQAAAQTAAAKHRGRQTTADQAQCVADELGVEAKTLADLKVEKAAVEGERLVVEASPRR